MTGDERVLIDIDGDGIMHITLHAPRRHNAMTLGMWRTLHDALAESSLASVRGILVRGGGESFCAGGDMREYARIATDPAFGADYVQTFTGAIATLRCAPIPVVAVLDGPVVGAGALLAAACDFRFATRSCRLAITAVKIGLAVPQAEIERLSSTFRTATLRRVLLAGAWLDAEALRQEGFVEDIVEREKIGRSARAFVATLASYPHVTFSAMKARLAMIESHRTLDTAADGAEALSLFQRRTGGDTA